MNQSIPDLSDTDDPSAPTHAEIVLDQLVQLDQKRALLRAHLLESIASEGRALRRAHADLITMDAFIHRWREASQVHQITGLVGAARDGVEATAGDMARWHYERAAGWDRSAKSHKGQMGDYLPKVELMVYALFDPDGAMIYVGRTRHPRARVKAHRHEKGSVVHSWEMWVCRSDHEMADLEAILIDQHNPPLNKRRERRNGTSA